MENINSIKIDFKDYNHVKHTSCKLSTQSCLKLINSLYLHIIKRRTKYCIKTKDTVKLSETLLSIR